MSVRVLASRDSAILTDEALEFLAELTRNHRPRLEELLARREAVQARYDAGEKPRFLPETAHVREGGWKARAWPQNTHTEPWNPQRLFKGKQSAADSPCWLLLLVNSWCGSAMSLAERFLKCRWLRCQGTCWTGAWKSPGPSTGKWSLTRCACWFKLRSFGWLLQQE